MRTRTDNVEEIPFRKSVCFQNEGLDSINSSMYIVRMFKSNKTFSATDVGGDDNQASGTQYYTGCVAKEGHSRPVIWANNFCKHTLANHTRAFTAFNATTQYTAPVGPFGK